jgi:RimJ/RimL family protein N-acetyltransferase
MSSNQISPFKSERLVYRAFNTPEDDEFFYSIQSDPVAFTNSCPSLPRPMDRKFAENIQKHVLESSLLFVVICRPAPAVPTKTGDDKTTTEAILEPIGTLFLKQSSPDMVHHRCTELGIDIKREFQGQGYGTEAIHWTLEWAFKVAGLHRVELMVLGWNERAKKLYERIGFQEEGRKREALWKDGKWWDEVFMGILQHELKPDIALAMRQK